MIKRLELSVLESDAPRLADFPEFERPIAHFVTDSDRDPQWILPCVVVADHGRGKISLWSLHSDANFAAVEAAKSDPAWIFQHGKNIQEAHCLFACPDGTYLAFYEKSSLGLRFDPDNRQAFLFDAPEAYGKDSGAVSFGTTAFPNPDPSADFFYTSFVQELPDGNRKIVDVRLAYDFSYWEPIRESSGSADLRLNVPHMTRTNAGIVYDSHFRDVSYAVPDFGSRILSRHELVDAAMRKAFAMFRQVTGADGDFEAHCSTEDGSAEFRTTEFRDFCELLRERSGCEKLNDLVCEKIFPGAELLPGKVSYYPVSDPENILHATTARGAPAHFEFSANGDAVYVSSHNFDIFLGGLRYFGPAAIDAFRIGPEWLVKKGTFEDPEGYRFTSHRVFENRLGRFVATIGQPNRFFVVRASDMKEAFHLDLAGNRLLEYRGKALDAWVRSTHTDPNYRFFRPFEISENGATAYVPHRQGAYYVDLLNPGAPAKSWNFSATNPEIRSELERLRVVNAHAYAIPKR